jgi:NAD(P)-dependent dehydrogenase (short-subunit alcohol dehydrogenase family)
MVKGLSGLGCDLVIICRNRENCQIVTEQLKRNFRESNVFCFVADLSSQSAIQTVTNKISDSFGRIDGLINNASCVSSKYKLTEENIELQFAVNHLAPFQLCHNLLPLLEKSEQGRIINVNSRAHGRGNMNFDDLYLSKNYNISTAYNQSKLANMLFTYALADKLKNTNITVNAFHPGLVNTDFGVKGVSSIHALVWKIMKNFGRSPAAAAQDAIYLATADEIKGVTGKYFHNKKEILSSTYSYNKDFQNRLWEISLQLTKITSNEYGQISES